MSPDKYCSLVEAEGGLSMVEEILNDNSEQLRTNMEKVKDLASVVRWVDLRSTPHGSIFKIRIKVFL